MPWLPELFSTPARERLEEKWELERLHAVPYYAGLMAGETEALIKSFAGEPVMHDPLHGRIIGTRAFEAYVRYLADWLAERNMSFDPLDDVVTETRALEEVLLHLDGQAGRVEVPVAVVADRQADGRLVELRVYHSVAPVLGRGVHRPPMLQRDPELRAPDVMAEYHRALVAGDVDAILATFEPDGSVSESARGNAVHEGLEGLRAFYRELFSSGGMALEYCAAIDTGPAFALEYNVLEWGGAELAPEAGLSVYVRGASGKLAATRIYTDAAPP